jgi:hypothetical protein
VQRITRRSTAPRVRALTDSQLNRSALCRHWSWSCFNGGKGDLWHQTAAVESLILERRGCGGRSRAPQPIRTAPISRQSAINTAPRHPLRGAQVNPSASARITGVAQLRIFAGGVKMRNVRSWPGPSHYANRVSFWTIFILLFGLWPLGGHAQEPMDWAELRLPNVVAAEASGARIDESPAIARSLWLVVGLGASSVDFLPVLVLAGSFRNESHVFSARASAITGNGVGGDIGVLYGRVVGIGNTYASVSGGLGRALGDMAGVGIPVEIQVSRRSRFVGLQLYAMGNINAQRSFGGVAAGVRIGSL